VFKAGLTEEPALFNSAMLTFTYAVTGSIADPDVIRYQSNAITSIRDKLTAASEGSPVTESILGAILLIVGVEARIGRRSHVEMHMEGLRQLLELCKSSQISLTDGIKRAIFW